MPITELRGLAAHPYAGLMPPMNDAQFSALYNDIESNGQRHTVTLHQGQILDGRNRVRALVALGRDAVVVDLPATVDPITYVLSNNVARRQLTPSQSAMIAARLVTTRQGVAAGDGDVSQADAADRLSVSARYVRDAQWLTERDEPLADRVFAGELTLAAAMRQARPQPERAPREVLIDVHPAIAEPEPVAQRTEDAIERGIRAMVGVDPGEWVLSLSDENRRALLLVLENFARRAYDTADEGGLLDSVPAPAPAPRGTPSTGGVTVLQGSAAAIAAARAGGAVRR
jgi:hypothetical protein